jgi:hypothetical protein
MTRVQIGTAALVLAGSLMFVSAASATADIVLEKTGSLDLGANGSANPGDLINYTFSGRGG